jgi:hypothetical protein
MRMAAQRPARSDRTGRQRGRGVCTDRIRTGEFRRASRQGAGAAFAGAGADQFVFELGKPA